MIEKWVSLALSTLITKTRRVLTLRSVTWSSCESMPKPGIRLANSTTPWMAGEKRSEKSSISRLPAPVESALGGNGLRGQVCVCQGNQRGKRSEPIGYNVFSYNTHTYTPTRAPKDCRACTQILVKIPNLFFYLLIG